MSAQHHMDQCLDYALRSYKTRMERAALRCALMDAAGLCDVIGRAIEAENRGRSGKGAVTKRGREWALIAKRCGDAIWQMRERIGFEDEPRP